MNKKNEIKQVLLALAAAKGLSSRLTESKIDSIAESLSNFSSATRNTVKTQIIGSDYIIKESVDFSDTDFWIDRIVDIINSK